MTWSVSRSEAAISLCVFMIAMRRSRVASIHPSYRDGAVPSISGRSVSWTYGCCENSVGRATLSLRSTGYAGDMSRSRWATLAPACLGYFFVLLDVTIVNVSLADMGRDLGTSREG